MPPIRREKRTMSEQTRIDEQLDQLVAERTSELAAANDALRKELAAERQRAEAAQRINEGGAQLILASIPGLVASLTPTGDVDFVNDPLIEYCGRTLEELQHWGTGDTVHPDDLPRVLQTFTQGIASGEPYDFEARLRRFDGVGFRFAGFRFGTSAGPFSVGTPSLPTSTSADARRSRSGAVRPAFGPSSRRRLSASM